MDFQVDDFIASFLDASALESAAFSSPSSLPGSPEPGGFVLTPPHDFVGDMPETSITCEKMEYLGDEDLVPGTATIKTEPVSPPLKPIPKPASAKLLPSPLPPISSVSPISSKPLSPPHTVPDLLHSQSKIKSAAIKQAPLQTAPAPVQPVKLRQETPAEPANKKRKISSPELPSPPEVKVALAANPAGSDEFARRQHRLIKNREAALMSRQRRKEHIKQLETQVNVLHKENIDLKKKVEALELKNAELNRRLQGGPKTTFKTAGVVVMVVFFSFVVFLNPLKIESTGLDITVIGQEGLSKIPGARVLQSAKDLELHLQGSIPAVASTPSETTTAVSTPNSYPGIEPSPEPEDTGAKSAFKAPANESGFDFEFPFEEDLEESHTYVGTNDLQFWIDQTLGTSKSEKGLSITRAVQPLQTKPDVAYVFCSEMIQILPNEKTNTGRPKLSLLVPSSSLEGSGEPANHIIQIDCEVLGTRVLPVAKTHTHTHTHTQPPNPRVFSPKKEDWNVTIQEPWLWLWY